jgi:hypothetical protein
MARFCEHFLLNNMNPSLNQTHFALTLLKLSAAASGAITLMISLTSCSSVPVPAGADLQGTWAQTGAGFERGRSVNWAQKVVIDKADGQGFAGFKQYSQDGGPTHRESINGVIGLDGHILFVDDDGTFQGRLFKGKLQGQYAEVGKDPAAVNLTLQRVP